MMERGPIQVVQRGTVAGDQTVGQTEDQTGKMTKVETNGYPTNPHAQSFSEA